MAATDSSAAPTPGSTVPASRPSRITGTTSAPTSGMTSALTSGDTRDCSAKTLSVTGASPTVTAICTVPRVRNLPANVRVSTAGRVTSAATITATATKDSQNPGARTLCGSNARTATRASASPWEGNMHRLDNRDPNTTASIVSARCVGSANPASSA